MSNISAVMPKGWLADLSMAAKPRRTFEEIIAKLAKNPYIKESFNLDANI